MGKALEFIGGVFVGNLLATGHPIAAGVVALVVAGLSVAESWLMSDEEEE